MVLNAIGDRFAHVSGSYTMNAGGAHLELIPAQDVKYVERVSMQFVNAGSNLHDVKVYGSCRVGTLGTVGGSDWTQLGDTIVVSGNTSSIKSISTTGLSGFSATASGTNTESLAYDAIVQNL